MDVKQVLVIRKDLKCRKGKMIAQGAHASLNVFFQRMTHAQSSGADVYSFINFSEAVNVWLRSGKKKITVSVDSEDELIEIYEKARKAGILCSIVVDHGLTEFKGVPTKTAVAVGPDLSELIDPITGHLKLL